MPQNILIITVGVIGLMAAATAAFAPPSHKKVGAAILLAWLLPGLGHAFLGKWKKGLFFLGMLTLMHAAGSWLSGFRTVSFDANPFYYVGQYGAGVTTLIGKLLTHTPPASHPFPLDIQDVGMLYVCVAGLLNLVILFNCFDVLPRSPAVEEKTT